MECLIRQRKPMERYYVHHNIKMPRPSTPIPNQPKCSPREFSRYRTPRDSGSPSTQWKYQADYAAQINSLTEFCRILWKEISKIRQPKTLGLDMFPFKIYSIPSHYKTNPTASIDWRTFGVHGGCVLTKFVSTGSYVFGTDQVKYPDLVTYPFPIGYNNIEVPLNCSQYWFWIEELTSSLPVTGSYILRHGPNPTVSSNVSGTGSNPNPWTTFPSASSHYLPIGYVDTLTSASSYYPYIRQYLRTDVLSMGGGNYTSMSVCVNGVAQTWMIDAYQLSGSI